MADKEEPSIEEILGSIRRIIAEDDDAPGATKTGGNVDVMEREEDEEEPLELTNKVQSEEPAPQEAEDMNVTFADPVMETSAVPAMPEERPAMSEERNTAQNTNEGLLSETTSQATANVMAQLARHTAINDEGHDGVTIENIVREMLKPMLRDWLDKNLPDLVQKMVARELDRISKRV
jgi:cell pole-organizing protein PopZ